MAKKFTELTTASQINETDIAAISQETGGVWGSFKATISAIAQKIITGINFANAFNTSDKTVAGAVNEKLTSNAVTDIEVSPAESAHSEGDYLIYNGLLYLVIDDIAIGDSLIIGTNIQFETLGTRMKHIEDGIEQACSQRIEKGVTYSLSHIICTGHNSGSGNYVEIFLPCSYDTTISNMALSNNSSLVIYSANGIVTESGIDFTVQTLTKTALGLRLELKYTSTKTANIPVSVGFSISSIVFS